MKEKVSFSLKSLRSLEADKDSCVYRVHVENKILDLHPKCLSNLTESIKNVLHSKATTYDVELNGIILSYKNVKVIDHVKLNNDGHFILNYNADVYVFKPHIGSILTGIVNKKAAEHIGCLVLSIFNVSIKTRREEFNIGQKITFSVKRLDYTARIPYIQGKIIHKAKTRSQ